jgi:hypothetical protein
MIFGTASDHAINMVPISLGFDERLQDEHADPFTAHIAIGLGREGFAASILREHARFAETDVQFGGDECVNTPNNGERALTALNGTHAPVNGDQG